MRRYIKIGEAAKLLGVTPQTIRRWEREGQVLPVRRSEGGTRYYDKQQLLELRELETELTVAYARASNGDRKEDLKHQIELLEIYCASKGWTYEVIQDSGSGISGRRKGLKQLLERIMNRQVKRLVLTHKDRLSLFAAELVFTLCELRNVEVVVINQGEEPFWEEERVRDILEVITLLSARTYGSRVFDNRKWVEAAKLLSELLKPDKERG
jgi:predicted site-specific integrase-resolvase